MNWPNAFATTARWAAVAVCCASMAHCMSARAAERDAVSCLADNVYYEAAGESWDGKLAVAQVTLNRAEGDPAKVCSAVYARSVVDGKKVAAFSWTLGRAWRARGPVNPLVHMECVWIAEGILHGLLYAPLDPSVRWYHADYVTPRWHKQFVTKIGHHLFYRSAG